MWMAAWLKCDRESTGKSYRQIYAGLLIAEHGKIKLFREAPDTLAASRAFSADGG